MSNQSSPSGSPNVRRNSRPSLNRRSSLVNVSSLQDLSKVASNILTDEPEDVMDTENVSNFEEVPGAWSGGVDEDEDPIQPILIQEEKARCQLVTGFVFTILVLLSSLFLAASLLNGGLPRYGVEEAEKITVYYEQLNIFDGEIKRNGNWKYYRFQTHHEVENITAHIKVTQEPDETRLPPLAVYLHVDILPTDAVDINGTSILQGSTTPSNAELDSMLSSRLDVCGPRTVYVGITLPYWTPATASLDDVHYELTIYRNVPESWEGLCETERFRAAIFVYILQPLTVGFCLIMCFSFYAIGLYNHQKFKQLQPQELTLADLENV